VSDFIVIHPFMHIMYFDHVRILNYCFLAPSSSSFSPPFYLMVFPLLLSQCCFLFLNLASIDWRKTVMPVFVWLAYCTWHDLQCHQFSSKWHNIILLYGLVKLHCIFISVFLCLFICFWTSRLILQYDSLSSVIINTCGQVYL
jgi:hypothetical protein